MRQWIALSIAMVALTTLSTRAAAQDDDDYANDDRKGVLEEPYFAPKLMLAAGGEGEWDGGSVLGVDATFTDELEPSYGLGFAYMHPVLHLLSLGAQVSVLSWTSDGAADADIDRNLYLDLSFLPQLNFAVAIVELYASVPIGFTLDFIGDDTAFGGDVASVSVGTGIGYHIGLMLGARLALARSFGLLAEIGYVAHNFSHEVEGMALGATVTNDVDVSIGQGALNLGVYF